MDSNCIETQRYKIIIPTTVIDSRGEVVHSKQKKKKKKNKGWILQHIIIISLHLKSIFHV